MSASMARYLYAHVQRARIQGSYRRLDFRKLLFTKKLTFKRGFEKGTSDNKDESGNTELEASKRCEFLTLQDSFELTFAYFSRPPFLNFGAKPEVLPVPRPLALVRISVWFDPGTVYESAVAPKSLLSQTLVS